LSYCPKCEYEYPVDIVTCPDCGERLVPRISGTFPAAVRPDDSWVLIGGVTSEVKARVARGSLDSNNIPSVFLPSKMNAVDQTAHSDTEPSVRKAGADLILVPKEFSDEAKLLLEAVLGDELVEPLSDNPLI
jgi:hypothetical protein